MSGLSGATIAYYDSQVHKSGGHVERTVAQGQWLQAHAHPALPVVVSVGQTGYTMERLFTEPKPNVGAVVHALAEGVWTRPAEVLFDPEALARKLTLIVRSFLMVPANFVPKLIAELVSNPQTPSLTHGDCTAENVMVRADGSVVVIDPVPASPGVPDLREVDHGKLLQSAIGWELVRGNDEVTPWRLVDLEDAIGSAGLALAAPWCAVHLLRALPYAEEEVHSGIIHLVRGLGL